MTSRTLVETLGTVEVADAAPRVRRYSLRRRLPLLIFALVGSIGGTFSWMAYREVKHALRLTGIERLTGAGGQVAELLGQSAAARLADTKRLAADPEVVASFQAPTNAAVAPALQSFVARSRLAVVRLYDAGGHPRGGPVKNTEAVTRAGTPPMPPLGISALESEGGRVWYHTSVAVQPEGAASPIGFLVIERSLAANQAGSLIARLIGSDVEIKFGNASGNLWTDLSAPVAAPPATSAGSSASYVGTSGVVRLGTAVAVPNTPWLLWTDIPEAAMLAPARTLLRRMLPIAIVVTALGALAVYVVSGRITHPLEQVAQAAGAIAAGDYSRRLAIDRGDELGRLAAAFNVMAGRVAESRDELESRVHARTRELGQYSAELAAANRELEAFSYSVSHDLRAPLRSIDGFAQALAEDYEDRFDDTGRDYLSRIRAAAQRMGMLIDDLLSLSRVSRMELSRADVDLSAIVREIAARLSEQEPGREVRWRIEPEVRVHGDLQLLRVAMDNLLSNAWKFTAKRRDAAIEFGVRNLPEHGRVVVVSDNGAGFDMAHAGKLFGAFQRLHRATEFPGTGVGLATVQRIVRRHGGRIWAEAAVEQGATFFFTVEA
jgi:signal transduction histidine kinase